MENQVIENSAVYETALGLYRMEYENDSITLIKKVESDVLGQGKTTKLTDKVYIEMEEYFRGERSKFDFSYIMKGTDFQKKVWSELIKIPYGETRTYKEIAELAGNPKASRAVGMANNRNPIAVIVPCHRVIGSNGSLTGYASGLDIKRKLLELEKTNKTKFY